jgi:predicted PurR-regulated permease PerM
MSVYDKIKVQPFYVKLAAVFISIISIGYLAILGKELLSPIIFSCLFAILLLPVAKWLEFRLHFPRSLAAMVSVLLLLAFVGTVLYVVGAQLSNLSNDWPLFKQQLATSLDSFQEWISRKYHVNQTRQLNYVRDATGKLLNSSTVFVGATLLSVSSMLLFLVFTFIYTFLFLVYRTLIMHFLVAVFMEENKIVVHDIIGQVQYIIRKYITGLLLEAVIVGSAVAIAFSIMGIRYAILLGIITGILNLVPYIGIFVAMILSCLITFATAAVAGKVLLVLLTLVAVHLVDSNILLPVIVGAKVRINAIVTLIGVIIGEMVWGISGMFLSIPVIAVMKIIFDRVETLKPWGILLGDEEKKKKERKIKKALVKVEESIT